MFGFAIGQTNDGGEIVALDSSGYGPVTITKSIVLTAPRGVFAGISPSSGVAIQVDTASPSDDVVLRNLVLRGNGATHGVRIFQGNVAIENSSIARFSSFGVFAPTGAEELSVSDTHIANNDSGIRADGPTSGASRRVSVDDCQFRNNGQAGLHLEHNVRGDIEASRFFQNGSFGLLVRAISATPVATRAVVDGSKFTSNGNAVGTQTDANVANVATTKLRRSTVAHNGTAFSALGNGQAISFGDNAVTDNDSLGSGFNGGTIPLS
jgi:hypothetical protein